MRVLGGAFCVEHDALVVVDPGEDDSPGESDELAEEEAELEG